MKLMCKVGAAVVAAGVAKCSTEPWCRLSMSPYTGLEDFVEAVQIISLKRVCQFHRLWIGLTSVRCSAKTALRLSAVLVDFDNPFPECACSDSCTWLDIAGKSEVRAHQMARKLGSAGFTPQKLRAELSSNLSALKLRGAGLTPQNLHAGLPSNLSMEQASGAQYTSGLPSLPGLLVGLPAAIAEYGIFFQKFVLMAPFCLNL